MKWKLRIESTIFKIIGANRAKVTKVPSNVAICIAELVGTGLLVFIGCMGCIHMGGGPSIHQIPALNFGLAVLLVIQIFGHISGAHLNPAVTIGAVFLGVVDYKVSPFYIIGQFAGAVVGFGLLKVQEITLKKCSFKSRKNS